MSASKRTHPRRVVIASANPIFREGLKKVYVARWGRKAKVVGMPTTMDETLKSLETLNPDLVIVDYDDGAINREEFLDRFMEGKKPMQVVLVSLGSSEPVVVYQRQQMTSAQADSWLANPWA